MKEVALPERRAVQCGVRQATRGGWGRSPLLLHGPTAEKAGRTVVPPKILLSAETDAGRKKIVD